MEGWQDDAGERYLAGYGDAMASRPVPDDMRVHDGRDAYLIGYDDAIIAKDGDAYQEGYNAGVASGDWARELDVAAVRRACRATSTLWFLAGVLSMVLLVMVATWW